jgi:hypothetical protein
MADNSPHASEPFSSLMRPLQPRQAHKKPQRLLCTAARKVISAVKTQEFTGLQTAADLATSAPNCWPCARSHMAQSSWTIDAALTQQSREQNLLTQAIALGYASPGATS